MLTETKITAKEPVINSSPGFFSCLPLAASNALLYGGGRGAHLLHMAPTVLDFAGYDVSFVDAREIPFCRPSKVHKTRERHI
jgi:hypothetical protein